MFHLFTEIESEVSKLGDAMKGVFSKVHATVSSAAEFTKEELQGGLAEFLAGINGADFSISQAFEAGAQYAATKLKAVVAPVVTAVEASPEVKAVEAIGSAVVEVAPAVSAAIVADAPAVASAVAQEVAPAGQAAYVPPQTGTTAPL